MDLIESLLLYNPLKRVSASEALAASYFTSELPGPELPEYVYSVPKSCSSKRCLTLCLYLSSLCQLDGEWHEYESKREREKTRRKAKADAKEKEKDKDREKEKEKVLASAPNGHTTDIPKGPSESGPQMEAA